MQAFERDFLVSGVIKSVMNGLAVSQRGAGANMSVDVATGRALYQITNTNLTPNKTYKVYHESDAIVNVPISTADPTNPRIDIIVMKCDVSQNPDSAAGNIPSITVVTGTPAGSPSAPATPANSLKLAQIAVAAGATSITNANITDSRAFVTVNSQELQDLARDSAVLHMSKVVFTDWSQKTLSSDAFTATGPLHTIEGEGAASDNLSTITAQSGTGEFLVLKCANAAHVITVKHNVGNIMTADGADFALNDLKKSITLIRQGSTWYELARAIGSPSTTNYHKTIPGGTTKGSATADRILSTAAETAFASVLNGRANELAAAGDKIYIRAFGGCRDTGTPTLQAKLKWGGTVLADFGSFTGANGVSNKTWEMWAEITADTVGASANLSVVAYFRCDLPTTVYESRVFNIANQDTDYRITGFDLTTAKDFSITMQWSAANAANIVFLNHFSGYTQLGTAA